MPLKRPKKTENLNIRVPSEFLKALNACARELDVSASQLARESIAKNLKIHGYLQDLQNNVLTK
jgi:hypothetical protein